uniref:Uncharacterized protein n=1 Tax=Ditylenchus dipsaci TaxID=166011 RepID=A0A915EWC9_9BILA
MASFEISNGGREPTVLDANQSSASSMESTIVDPVVKYSAADVLTRISMFRNFVGLFDYRSRVGRSDGIQCCSTKDREQEDLELALALSRSEAEAKIAIDEKHHLYPVTDNELKEKIRLQGLMNMDEGYS